MTIADKETVKDFLKKWESACSNNIFIVPRGKNRDSLTQLEWTFARAKAELKKLSLTNYVQGPNPDRDKPNDDFWIFGKSSAKGDVYIKVKIFENKQMDFAKCVSFHLAEYPLRYPYK